MKQFNVTSTSERTLLSQEQEYALFQRLRQGESRVREQLIFAFMPLAEAVAHRHYWRIHWVLESLELDDVISAACEGLLKAVDRHDHTQGSRFSTFAKTWIEKEVRLHIRGEKWWAPSITDYTYKLLLAALKIQRLDEDIANGDHPPSLSPSEEEARASWFNRISGGGSVARHRLSQILSWTSFEVISLDAPLRDGDNSLINMLESTAVQSPLTYASYEALQSYVYQVLRTLTPQEERVIRLRFGCDQLDERSLEEVARIMKLTAERVRQIETVAIRKLRHPSRMRRLRCFAEADQ